MDEMENEKSFYVGQIKISLLFSKKEPCMVESMTVGQSIGNIFDFGLIEDLSPNINEDGCQDRGFVPLSPTPKIIRKYGITEEQFYNIALQLRDILHLGKCDKCVVYPDPPDIE